MTVSLAAICTVLSVVPSFSAAGGAPERRAGHCSESVCARNFLKCPEITPDDKTQQQKTKRERYTLVLLFKKTNVISFG